MKPWKDFVVSCRLGELPELLDLTSTACAIARHFYVNVSNSALLVVLPRTYMTAANPRAGSRPASHTTSLAGPPIASSPRQASANVSHVAGRLSFLVR
jgi:hypothetical protein